MTEQKDNNQKKPTSKLSTLLTSIIGAIIIWAIVAFGTGAEIDKRIEIDSTHIRFLNENILEERGLIVLPLDKPTDYSLTVNGSRNDIVKAINSLSIDVDLSTITVPGEQTVSWSLSGRPSNLGIKRSFSEVVVNIDRFDTKNFDISVEHTNENNTFLIDSRPVNEKVSISGAESELDKVDHVEVTVDDSVVTSDIISDYVVSFIDKDGNELKNLTTLSVLNSAGEKIDNKISIENTVYRKKNVNILSDIPQDITDNYQITINGSEQTSDGRYILANITVGVRDETEDIENLYADFSTSTFSLGTVEFDVKVAVPQNVFVYEGDQTVHVNAEIKKIRTISVPITVTGCAADLTYIQPPNIEIQILSTTDNIQTSSINAYADISGRREGTHNITLSFSTPDEIEVQNEYTTDITITNLN